jgi:hypothetical protein
MSDAQVLSAAWWDVKAVEPVQRRCAGRPVGYVAHRFAIKGGLPRRVLLGAWGRDLAAAMARPSWFYQRMQAAKGPLPPMRLDGPDGIVTVQLRRLPA